MTIIHQVHETDCGCSYCRREIIHYGLNIPTLWKVPNSWFVIKYWPGRYIRWTNSWLRHFIRT